MAKNPLKSWRKFQILVLWQLMIDRLLLTFFKIPIFISIQCLVILIFCFFLAKPYFDLLFKSVWSWEAWGYKALKGDVRLGLSGAIYLSSDLRQRYEEILSLSQHTVKVFYGPARERVKTWKMSTVIMHSNITSWQKCILFHTFFHT